jgi:hypothetical protein
MNHGRLNRNTRVIGAKERIVMMTTNDVIQRLRAEYIEMPGMRLTAAQVQRLCGIEQTLCRSVLESLVRTRFLCLRPDGTYGRTTDRDLGLPHRVETNLKSHRMRDDSSGTRRIA